MKKIITNKEIQQIKEFAQYAFHQTPEFIDLDAKEMQIACILMGFERFRNINNLPLDYEIRLKEKGDCESLEELTPGGAE